jgi:hypothetical protein
VEGSFIERILFLIGDFDVGIFGAKLLDACAHHVFGFVGDVHGVVHVGGFLEFTTADESIYAVLGTGDPADIVVSVEVTAELGLFL